MNRVLLIVLVFLLVTPVVWRIVEWLSLKIEGKMSSPELDADKFEEQRRTMLDDLGKRNKLAETEAKNAQKAIRKLKK